MNKKLFLSIVLLSSTAVIYSNHDCSGHDCSDHPAMAENMDNKIEAAGHMVADKAKSAAKSIGNKMEDMGERIAEETENLAGEVEVESKNIFEKAKDFIMGLVSSVMNFFHGLFGG